jgi:hypothetical protein
MASFAPLDEVFSVSYGRGPIESRSVRLTDKVRGCHVAATLAAVNLLGLNMMSLRLDPLCLVLVNHVLLCMLSLLMLVLPLVLWKHL